MIVEYVKMNHKATVNELCERFLVSPATIRNDLRELAEYGLLERTHGGAMIKSSVNFELNNTEKKSVGVQQKKAIARQGLKLPFRWMREPPVWSWRSFLEIFKI